MASTPLGDDSYPEPVLDAGRGGAGLWRVVVLGLVLVVVAVVFSLFGDRIPSELVMTFVGVLAVAGVFFLFGLAAGLFRFAGSEDRRTLSHAVVDSLPFGAVIADREGKITYVNHHYGSFPGAMTNGVPVGVPRLFSGYADAGEAIYRLSRAARDGRSAIEDIRVPGGLGGSQAEANRVFWYRVSVRPLPQTDDARKPLVAWSVEDITRDRENNETAFRDQPLERLVNEFVSFFDVVEDLLSEDEVAPVDPHLGFVARAHCADRAVLVEARQMERDGRVNGDEAGDLSALLESLDHFRQGGVGQAIAVVSEKILFVL